MKKVFGVWAAGLVLALTACAAGTEVTSTPDGPQEGQQPRAEAGRTAKVGDKITLAGSDENLKVAVTVLKVVNTRSTDAFEPEKGNRFVAVRIALKNTGTLPYDDSPSNGAKLLDADDQQYDAALVTGVAAGPLLDSVKMAPGKGRQGVIVFSVPKSAKPASFQFTLDSGFAPQTGEWTLS